MRWFLFGMAIFIAIYELAEHYLHEGSLLDPFLALEIGIFSIGVPIVGFLVLRYVERLESERSKTLHDLDTSLEFSRQLSQVTDWGQLARQVAGFPARFLPVIRSHFYYFNPDEDRYTDVTAWDAGKMDAEPARKKPVLCQYCLRERGHFFHPTLPVAGEEHEIPEGVGCFCLPLVVLDRHIGVIQMQMPQNYAMRPADELLLNGSAIELAFAVDRARLDRSATQRDAAAESERSRIARDLHDTLGQNIAYLRLKLDELMMEENLDQRISVIHAQLDQMRRTADEAYNQVRSTLGDLNPSQSQALGRLLLRRAREVGQRAGFAARLQQEGTPRPLSDTMRQQILYIAREALNNIEKHAAASEVNIRFRWQDHALALQISDNGRGFVPQTLTDDDHYGLAIMRERAQMIGGNLDINATPGGGTTISLTLPLAEMERGGA